MYEHYSTWILVIVIASFALPALAADDVIPDTSEDIEAFDRALTRTRQQERTDEPASSAAQERTRTRAEVRDEKGAAEPAGEAAQTKSRVQTRSRVDKQLNKAVSEEAEKMKNEQVPLQERRRERARVRSEQKFEEGQGTTERSRVMRDYSGGGGERTGQGGPPEGAGSSGSGPQASEPIGSGQLSGGRRGR